MPLSLREKLKQASQANLANNAAKTMRKLSIMERPEPEASPPEHTIDPPTHATTQEPTHRPFHQPGNLSDTPPTNPQDYPITYPPTQAPTVPLAVAPTNPVAVPFPIPPTNPQDYPLNNPGIIADLWEMLTQAQRRVLAHLATHPGEILRYEGIAAATALPVGTVQTIFKRLKKLNVLTSHYGSRGTIKGMRFSLDKTIFQGTVPGTNPQTYPEAIPLNYPPTNHPSSPSIHQPSHQPIQEAPYVLIEREKNLSISLRVLQTTWPKLAETGFGLEQVRQIVDNLTALGKPTDRILAGLDHIEFELTHDQLVDKDGQPVSDPCSWAFRALAQNGYYRRPKGYVSAEEQALRDQEEEAKALLTARKNAEQAQFEAWQASLSPEELAVCLRDHPGGPKEAWLKHIWKEKGGKPA